ncbi:hypothetical protein [Salinibacter ruber]|uniref:hypothetical protein n=1 Tax=Salinibacter ruber TaxID=146919 RepID=UPI0021694AD7|nr:hypothetical protein [Salinibacter ruber]MCS4051423.1 hypothetical protein [Salinibacter ruber]
MTNTDISDLNLDLKEEVEATVESDEILFSTSDLEDRGYILSTEDGKRKWRLKGDEAEGDDFEEGDRIRIILKDRRIMKPWPKGTTRSSPRNEPDRTFKVENLSAERRD